MLEYLKISNIGITQITKKKINTSNFQFAVNLMNSIDSYVTPTGGLNTLGKSKFNSLNVTPKVSPRSGEETK